MGILNKTSNGFNNYPDYPKNESKERYSRGWMWFVLWFLVAISIVFGLSLGAMALINHFVN